MRVSLSLTMRVDLLWAVPTGLRDLGEGGGGRGGVVADIFDYKIILKLFYILGDTPYTISVKR